MEHTIYAITSSPQSRGDYNPGMRKDRTPSRARLIAQGMGSEEKPAGGWSFEAYQLTDAEYATWKLANDQVMAEFAE